MFLYRRADALCMTCWFSGYIILQSIDFRREVSFDEVVCRLADAKKKCLSPYRNTLWEIVDSNFHKKYGL